MLSQILDVVQSDVTYSQVPYNPPLPPLSFSLQSCGADVPGPVSPAESHTLGTPPLTLQIYKPRHKKNCFFTYAKTQISS